MFEMQISKGVEYLDKDLGPSWIDRISLEELDLVDCYYCIIGQLYGDFFDKFFSTNHAVEFGFCIPYTTRGFLGHTEYKQLTQEWKEKIAQLKAERRNNDKWPNFLCTGDGGG